MKIKVEKYEYICRKCNKEFEIDRLAGRDYIYGEFLLRSQSQDNVVYLNAISDAVFNELSSILDTIATFDKIDWSKKAKILHHLFGFTCDPDIDGSLYMMDLKPKCPYCGLRQTSIINPVEPIKIFEKDFSGVKHDAWNKLNRSEKRALIEAKWKEWLELSTNADTNDSNCKKYD